METVSGTFETGFQEPAVTKANGSASPLLAVLDRDLPWIVQDAVGLQPLFYSSGTEAFAASSHAQFLAP